MVFSAIVSVRPKNPQNLFPPLTTILLRSYSNDSHTDISSSNIQKSYANFFKQCHEKNKGKAAHAHLIKNPSLSTIYLHNFALNMYLKCGDFDSAVKLFDTMPERNVVSWTNLVSGFSQHGFSQKGLFFFTCMYNSGVRPMEFTLVSALSACACSSLAGNNNVGFFVYQLYGLVVKLGFEWNVFVINAFVTALVRNGEFGEAMKAFDDCPCRDIVSWNTMMAGLLRFSSKEVPGFWLRMRREGVKPDGYTFSTVLSGLGALGDGALGMQVHGQLVKCGHGVETCVANSLVDMYLKFEDVVAGFKAFREIVYKNVLSWTAMATGCVNCGVPSKALELLEEMKMTGISPNKFSLATTFKACANMSALDKGKKGHALRLKFGSAMDVCVDNAMLDMYIKCGCVDDAMKVFRRINNRTIVTWTTMVMGLAQNGRATEALGIFDEMVNDGVQPNYITFVCVLYACCQGGFVKEGWKYFSSMTNQYKISPGEDHYICMVDLLGRTGHVKEAEELISKMPFHPGPLIWQTLLGACHIFGDIEVAQRAAQSALDHNNYSPSTYVLLSNINAGLSDWEGAEALRDMMQTGNVNKIPGASLVPSTR